MEARFGALEARLTVVERENKSLKEQLTTWMGMECDYYVHFLYVSTER